MSDKIIIKTSPVQISFCGLLTLIFITLKLTGYITWSWLWVVSPLWIPLALFVAIIVIFGVVAITVFGIGHLINGIKKWFKK